MLDLTQEKNDFSSVDKEFALIENRFSEIDGTIDKLRKNDANNKKELNAMLQEKEELSRKVNDSKYDNTGEGRTQLESLRTQIENLTKEKETLSTQFQNS